MYVIVVRSRVSLLFFSHALLHEEKGVALSFSLFILFSTYTHTMSHLAVYGGAGALGRALVTYFKERGFVSIQQHHVHCSCTHVTILVCHQH